MDMNKIRSTDMETAISQELEISMICSSLNSLHICPNLVMIYSIFQSNYLPPNELWELKLEKRLMNQQKYNASNTSLISRQLPTRSGTLGHTSQMNYDLTSVNVGRNGINSSFGNTNSIELQKLPPMTVNGLIQLPVPSLPLIKKSTSPCYQYVRMEFCSGGDLEDYVLKNGPKAAVKKAKSSSLLTSGRGIVDNRGDTSYFCSNECVLNCTTIRQMLFQMFFSIYSCREQLSMRHFDVKLLNFLVTVASPSALGHKDSPRVSQLSRIQNAQEGETRVGDSRDNQSGIMRRTRINLRQFPVSPNTSLNETGYDRLSPGGTFKLPKLAQTISSTSFSVNKSIGPCKATLSPGNDFSMLPNFNTQSRTLSAGKTFRLNLETHIKFLEYVTPNISNAPRVLSF